MVKGSLKIARDAQYEAQLRTVEVSSKPAVGKEMFSDILNQATEGAFKGSFETERFVHGKIREFTLRIASHSSEVRALVPENTARIPSANASASAGEYARDIEDALFYRVVAESVDHALGKADLAFIPKNLRAYVLAKMIEHSDMSVMNHTEDRALLQARLRFKGVLNRGGFISKAGSSLHIQAAGLLMAAIFSSEHVQNNDHSFKHQANEIVDKMKIADLCGFFTSGQESFSLLQSFAGISCNGSRVDSIKVQNAQNASSSSSSVHNASSSSSISCQLVALRMEEGFGTAPIWYQQSMATGPPLQASR